MAPLGDSKVIQPMEVPVATEQEAVRRKLKDEGYGSTFDWMSAKEHLIEEQHGLPAAEQHRIEALALAQAEGLKRQREQPARSSKKQC